MAVTRAVIDLRARSIDSHGVLKDIDRALSLLAQHNLDVGGVGNLSSGAASIDNVSRNPDDMESDGPIAVTNHLPQVSQSSQHVEQAPSLLLRSCRE